MNRERGRNERSPDFYRARWVAALLLLLVPVAICAQRAVEEGGNVILLDPDGFRRQVTSSGRDYDPSLSPDRSRIIFAHRVRGSLDNPDTLVSELWIAEATSGWRPHIVFRTPVKIEGQSFSAFFSPQLSPDNRYAYFLIPFASVTEGVVRLDLPSGKTAFVVAAMRFWVVPGGQYSGDLIAQVRKAKVGAGYYYWFYLFSPDGKELGLIGPDEKAVEDFLAQQKGARASQRHAGHLDAPP